MNIIEAHYLDYLFIPFDSSKTKTFRQCRGSSRYRAPSVNLVLSAISCTFSLFYYKRRRYCCLTQDLGKAVLCCVVQSVVWCSCSLLDSLEQPLFVCFVPQPLLFLYQRYRPIAQIQHLCKFRWLVQDCRSSRVLILNTVVTGRKTRRPNTSHIERMQCVREKMERYRVT